MPKFIVPVLCTVEANDYDEAQSKVDNWLNNDVAQLKHLHSTYAPSFETEILTPDDCELDNYNQRVIYLHNAKEPQKER